MLSLSGTHFFGLSLARFSLSRVTFLRQLCAYYRVRKKNLKTPWRCILKEVYFQSFQFRVLHDVPSLRYSLCSMYCQFFQLFVAWYTRITCNTDFLFQTRGLCSRFLSFSLLLLRRTQRNEKLHWPINKSCLLSCVSHLVFEHQK